MFHMSKVIYDKAAELGKLVAESEQFKNLQMLEEAGEKDPELSACVAAYLEKRQKLEDETLKDEKDFDVIAALTREIEEESQHMNQIPAYKNLQQARKDYNAMMSAINEVMYFVMYPDANGGCSCSGNCSTCSGCSTPKTQE